MVKILVFPSTCFKRMPNEFKDSTSIRLGGDDDGRHHVLFLYRYDPA